MLSDANESRAPVSKRPHSSLHSIDALWPGNRVARALRADAAKSPEALCNDLERLVRGATLCGRDDPRLPLWSIRLAWHRVVFDPTDALRAASDRRPSRWAVFEPAAAADATSKAKLNARAVQTVDEVALAARQALKPDVEAWEDAFAKTIVTSDGAVVGGDPRRAEVEAQARFIGLPEALPLETAAADAAQDDARDDDARDDDDGDEQRGDGEAATAAAAYRAFEARLLQLAADATAAKADLPPPPPPAATTTV